jgi:uncharacterized membrane protein YgcG
MNIRSFLSLLVLTFCLFLFIFAAPAFSKQSERILEFKSRMQVQQDGSMRVTEEISVVCAGQQIKRGIYRDFPTKYKDRYGNTVKVGFEVLEVLRDGFPEPYHFKTLSNGKRVYIGKKEVLLKPGIYNYTLTYKTDRQLGYFEDFDELYWNVTGNGWGFVIERVEALVELPPGADILRSAAYTGRFGEKGQDSTTAYNQYGNIIFTTTKKLMPNEGLTIAVAWPKGFVSEPTTKEKLTYLWKDNNSVATSLIGLLVLACFYFIGWHLVGKDPPEGTIFPLFSPPKWVSPALARLIMRLGRRDHKLFAVAVVNMAVKGYLTIKEDESGTFTLKRTGGGETKLSGGEVKIARRLFGDRDKIILKNSNHEKIGSAMKELQKYLMKGANKKYFILNSSYFIVGLFITFVTLASVILTAEQLPFAVFMCVWLSIWTAGCFMLGLRVVNGWRSALGSGGVKVMGSAGALGVTLFALPFFAGEVFGLGAFSSAVSPFAAITLVVMVFTNALFYHLLKAPTLMGRKLMDKIEGFKLYLSVAEKERLNILNPPEKTQELFEKYLPYALALDVENEWSEQFATALAASGVGGRYRPNWYSGNSWRTDGIRGVTSSLGSSLPGAISSSSTAPGSSSGSGGGGSSGGGGGGGGGGGW